jgi:hypothetical protein
MMIQIRTVENGSDAIYIHHLSLNFIYQEACTWLALENYRPVPPPKQNPRTLLNPCLCKSMSPEAHKESRADPPPAGPSGYTAFLLTTLVVLVLGILIAHAFMMSKLNDHLSTMSEELSSVASAVHKPTVVVDPSSYGVFTMKAI